MLGGRDRMTVRSVRWMLGIALVAVGCFDSGNNDDDDDDDDDAGEAGQPSSGGSSASGGSGNGGSNGGTVSSGGSNGGTISSGGANGGSNGGTVSSGGSGGSNGGSVSAGGAGGSAANGGSVGETGGVGGTTGGTGVGGATGGVGGETGGTGGSDVGGTGGTGGGGSIECGTAYATHAGGYVTSPGASGCWKGYAYTVVDAFGTTVAPTDFATCTDESCSLCVSGTVTIDFDYASYAGMGVNLNQSDAENSPENSVTPAGSGLTVSWTNAGGSELRVQIQNGSTARWCYPLTGASGVVTIPYSSFNTECWEGGLGVAYAGEAITGVQLTVPGNGLYDTPYSFCLNSVVDGSGPTP